ncbi:uncharacterized protein LOC135698522 [Ochlerotatus camptorhynchus]|uniref:uncharacterized protein LOC135698522 n=1 Tax=Ochlerotatus camptorhynchus TaxID=644619 RepID=UPI0031DBFE71
MASELKSYLVANGYPLSICWSEDATRISGGVEYRSDTDQLSGLVATLDSNTGLPIKGLFNCSTPQQIIKHIRNYPIAMNVELGMAQPMATGAAPFCCLYYCTDNRFDTESVTKKWHHIKRELQKAEIQVVCKATDGDTRFIRAMIDEMEFNKSNDHSFGEWFASNNSICVQDPTHLANKLRTRLMKASKQLLLGNYNVSRIHLLELITTVSKDKHGLCMSDIDEKDKMKFKPVEKMTEVRVISCLSQIPNSNGTATLLRAIGDIMSSYMDEKLSPLQKVYNIWHSLFLIRGWRNWCVRKFNNILNCITSNAYWGLEINAHALINYVVYCRDHGTEFNTTLLQSQTCEGTFRDARAFTSTESTVVNFTIQGFESRLNRIQFKRDVMHRNQQALKFPGVKKRSMDDTSFKMPTTDEIIDIVEQAQQSARDILIDLGVDANDISFECSVSTKSLKEKPTTSLGDVEFITVPDEFETFEKNSNNDIHDASELFQNVGSELLLRNSINHKNVFKIKTQQNKVVHVKKRTFLWMLISGLQKCSTDRTYRFMDNNMERHYPKYANEVYDNIVVGEFVLIKENEMLSVLKVYGFKYLKGKNCSYSSPMVPIKPPKDVQHRGIGLLGTAFEILECDGEYVLDFSSNNSTKNVKYYVSHLKKPSILSALFYYPNECVSYIKQF